MNPTYYRKSGKTLTQYLVSLGYVLKIYFKHF